MRKKAVSKSKGITLPDKVYVYMEESEMEDECECEEEEKECSCALEFDPCLHATVKPDKIPYRSLVGIYLLSRQVEVVKSLKTVRIKK